MTDAFLSAILTTSQAQQASMEKLELMKRLEEVYQHSLTKITELCPQENVIQSFQNYCQQIKDIITQQPAISSSQSLSTSNSQAKSISDDPLQSQKSSPAIQQPQSQYLFLRTTWQSKYQPSVTYDPQDHIDRINKVVAMVKMRTNYMIKKQSYLHDKEESIVSSYMFDHPLFMKMKEELENVKMRNEELVQRCCWQGETITRLETEKSQLLQNFTNMKKKFQQMQKSYIQISKKNIWLQQDSFILRNQNSPKNKLNSMRESINFTNITGIDLRPQTSFSRFAQQAKTTERSTEPSQGTIKPFLPLENMFVDISLNLNSNRENNKQLKTNNIRYVNNDSENEENTSSSVNLQTANKQNQNLQVLAMCRSQRLITEESPMRLKYIRNHNNSSARKTLLSSARSIDLADKTSLNKPKFQRTKPNYQKLLKSVKKDDYIMMDTKGENPTLLKRNNVMSDGIGSTKTFRNIKEQVIQIKEGELSQ